MSDNRQKIEADETTVLASLRSDIKELNFQIHFLRSRVRCYDPKYDSSTLHDLKSALSKIEGRVTTLRRERDSVIRRRSYRLVRACAEEKAFWEGA